MKCSALLSLCAVMFALTVAAAAQAPKATVDLYNAKCAVCHGPDGRASSPTAKALQAHDFSSDAVQSQTDEQLAATITNGKLKMPAFGKQLSPEQIQSLVAYVRELGGKGKP